MGMDQAMSRGGCQMEKETLMTRPVYEEEYATAVSRINTGNSAGLGLTQRAAQQAHTHKGEQASS